MSRILVLGATGRSGSAILAELAADSEVVAAIRTPADTERLPVTRADIETAIVDLRNPDTLQAAVRGAGVIVNAIRLRDDITPDALMHLHDSLRDAAPDALIVTVGGAGSLRLADGTRFWQHPAFPVQTLPRGIAHARLRDHLESGAAGSHWTYLIPPPAFNPDGPRTARYAISPPSDDESTFVLSGAISYADFAIAAAQAASSPLPRGTLLVDTR